MPPCVTARDRIPLAPECLYEEGMKLYCRPCHMEITFKKINIVKNHLISGGHLKMVDMVMKYGPQHPPDAAPKPVQPR